MNAKTISALFTITIIFVLLTISVMSQEPATTFSNKGRFIIAYNPVPLLYQEYSGYVEYFYKRDRSIAFEAGYVKSMSSTYSIIPFLIYNGVVTRTSFLKYKHKSKINSSYKGLRFIGKWQWNDNVCRKARLAAHTVLLSTETNISHTHFYHFRLEYVLGLGFEK
ncbi:MAG: hypothetical protein U9R19_03620 [Bacteroidota bacterium]|nr:hypothetical protein [Bacteroidota bacterium]